MSIEQAKQVKITATNIKSSLISGNKKLRKIRIDENNFLKKIESDRRKREKIASIGKAFKPAKSIANKLIVKPGGSLLSKIFDFFSIMLAGIIIKALPQLLEAIKGFFDKISPFLKAAKNILGSVGEAIGSFFEVFNKTPAPDIGKLDDDKSKIEKDLKKVNEDLEKVGVEVENYKSDTKIKEKEFRDDHNEKKKKGKSVDLSDETSKLVRQEYESAEIDERSNKGDTQKAEGGQGGNNSNTSVASANNNIEGVKQNTSNLTASANLNVNKSNNPQKLNKGGIVGGNTSYSSKDIFKGFEINAFDQKSNLKDQETNVELFKDFGNGLIGASSLSSSSPTSSASSFSLADSTSGLPIVGRVGNTGQSTGPHVHVQRFPQPTNWQRDHITKDHPVMNNILVGGKPLNEWTFTSPASPDRWGSPHYGPDFGGDGINNQPIQLTGGITYDSSSLYQQSAGPEGNNILFTYNGEQFVIFHLNSGPESKSSPGMGGMLKGVVPTRLQRGNINVDMDEEYVYMLQQHLLSVIT